MSQSIFTIEDVVSHNACTGCATCVGVCHYDGAIKMEINPVKGIYEPKINGSFCVKCNLCLLVCPEIRQVGKAKPTDAVFELKHVFGELSEDVFGELPLRPAARLIGQAQSYHLAHAKSEDLRYNASSGGAVSMILIEALRQGQIDGALVVRMDEQNPLLPRVIIATTEAEIIGASGSKYCPVPLNIALQEILHFNGKIAVVGLPCHIRGLRLAQKRFKKLRENIVCFIGLVCHHTVSFHGTEFVSSHLGMQADTITHLEYRGRGWPGSMLLCDLSGKQRTLGQQQSWGSFEFFSPISCFTCYDGANELADISVADPWIPRLKDAQGKIPGETLVIVRTEIGNRFIQAAVNSGALKVSNITEEETLISLHGPTVRKKVCYQARLRVMKLLGLKAPEADIKSPIPWWQYAFAFYEINMSRAMLNPGIYRFFLRVPRKILNLIVIIGKTLILAKPGKL